MLVGRRALASAAAGLSAALSSRRVRRWLVRVAVLAVALPLALQWLLAYVVGGDARLLPRRLQGARSLLVVTAHPDDECLFFAPSVLGVLDRGRRRDGDGGNGGGMKGGLLVMSTGNNYGLGELRTRELRGSCAALGIDEARCVALDRPELQDNPKVWWDTDLIQKIVREYVAKWEVDAIITFDSGGVSGHINHRAVSAAISEYVNSDASAPEAYMVVTTSLLRKYTVLGDLPLTALRFTWRIVAALVWPSPGGAAASNSGMKGAHSHDSSKVGGGGALVANSWGRYLVTRAAFRQHGSQYSWDRHLYMVLSRYVWFNDLVRARKA